jgi:hypothetical protein
MPVSTEILLKAKERGLTVMEVPVTVYYDVEKASSLNPALHGVDLVFALVQHISIHHPLAS